MPRLPSFFYERVADALRKMEPGSEKNLPEDRTRLFRDRPDPRLRPLVPPPQTPFMALG